MKNVMRMNEYDNKLFKYLYYHKVASIKQINDEVYNFKNSRSVYKRLSQLTADKYIKKKINVHNGTLLFLLNTEKKIDIFKNDDYKCAKFQSENPYHDLLITDISKYLKGMSSVTKVIQENEQIELKNSQVIEKNVLSLFNYRPDIFTIVQKNETKFYCFFEIETSEKSNERYQKKIIKIYNAPNLDVVFYLSNNNKILEKIINIDSLIRNEKNKIFYGMIDDFYKLGFECLKNVDGRYLKF